MLIVGSLVRDPKTGLCMSPGFGEPGLLVSKILAFDRGGPKAFKVICFHSLVVHVFQ